MKAKSWLMPLFTVPGASVWPTTSMRGRRRSALVVLHGEGRVLPRGDRVAGQARLAEAVVGLAEVLLEGVGPEDVVAAHGHDLATGPAAGPQVDGHPGDLLALMGVVDDDLRPVTLRELQPGQA